VSSDRHSSHPEGWGFEPLFANHIEWPELLLPACFLSPAQSLWSRCLWSATTLLPTCPAVHQVRPSPSAVDRVCSRSRHKQGWGPSARPLRCVRRPGRESCHRGAAPMGRGSPSGRFGRPLRLRLQYSGPGVQTSADWEFCWHPSWHIC